MCSTDGSFCPYAGKSCTRNLGSVGAGDCMGRICPDLLGESKFMCSMRCQHMSPVCVQEGGMEC